MIRPHEWRAEDVVGTLLLSLQHSPLPTAAGLAAVALSALLAWVVWAWLLRDPLHARRGFPVHATPPDAAASNSNFHRAAQTDGCNLK